MPLCNQAETCDDYKKTNGRGCYCNACFDHNHQNTLDPQAGREADVRLNNLLAAGKRVKSLEDVLKKIIHGYEEAPGEMWIPDYIDKQIDIAKEMLRGS